MIMATTVTNFNPTQRVDIAYTADNSGEATVSVPALDGVITGYYQTSRPNDTLLNQNFATNLDSWTFAQSTEEWLTTFDGKSGVAHLTSTAIPQRSAITQIVADMNAGDYVVNIEYQTSGDANATVDVIIFQDATHVYTGTSATSAVWATGSHSFTLPANGQMLVQLALGDGSVNPGAEWYLNYIRLVDNTTAERGGDVTIIDDDGVDALNGNGALYQSASFKDGLMALSTTSTANVTGARAMASGVITLWVR